MPHYPALIRICHPLHDQLLASEYTRCHHSESRPDGTHTAVEYESGGEWVGFFDDTDVGI